MADTLDTATPRNLLVNGRNPFADEVITVSDSSILQIGTPNADGSVTVTGLSDGTATITVVPGSESDDTGFGPGSDDITVTTTVVTPPTPLTVSLQ